MKNLGLLNDLIPIPFEKSFLQVSSNGIPPHVLAPDRLTHDPAILLLINSADIASQKGDEKRRPCLKKIRYINDIDSRLPLGMPESLKSIYTDYLCLETTTRQRVGSTWLWLGDPGTSEC